MYAAAIIILALLLLVGVGALWFLYEMRGVLQALSAVLAEPVEPPIVHVAAPVVNLPAPVVHVEAPVVHVGSSRSAPEHPGAVELMSRENSGAPWETQGWARENSIISREYYQTPNKAVIDKGVLVEGVQ